VNKHAVVKQRTGLENNHRLAAVVPKRLDVLLVELDVAALLDYYLAGVHKPCAGLLANRGNDALYLDGVALFRPQPAAVVGHAYRDVRGNLQSLPVLGYVLGQVGDGAELPQLPGLLGSHRQRRGVAQNARPDDYVRP